MLPHLLLALGHAAVIAASAQECGKRNDHANYIVGGEIAIKNEFPWQVSLQVNTKDKSGQKTRRHICGASLINDRWIATAASCILPGVQKEDYSIVLGAQRLDDVGFPIQTLGARQIVVHPLWNKTTLQHDIALIQMDAWYRVREESAAPICLPDVDDASRFHGTCTTAGWGALYPNTGPVPNLLKVDLAIVSNEHCASDYQNASDHRIDQYVMCAGHDGTGPCEWDGGNALACGENGVYYLAGITSFSSCGSARYPAVFTRVSAYRTWIDVNIS